MTLLDDLGAIGTGAVASAYGRWTDQVLVGTPDPRTARKRLGDLRATALERVLYEGRLRGIMLGVLVGWAEVVDGVKLDRDETRRLVESTLTVGRDVVERPFAQAVRAFRSRVPISKRSWEMLTERERRRAFTVAGLARNDFVRVAQKVMAQALEEGWESGEFRDALSTRLEAAGMSTLNPSHADTVFRTNMSTAHADGRMGVFTQPAVLRARPFWEWAAVEDKTTRPTHEAMSGLAMRADDPAWRRMAPPAGFRCRCTIAPVREEQAGEIVTSADSRVQALPDEGWQSSGFPFGMFDFDEEAEPVEAASARVDGILLAESDSPIDIDFTPPFGEELAGGDLEVLGPAGDRGVFPVSGSSALWVPRGPLAAGLYRLRLRADFRSGRRVERILVVEARRRERGQAAGGDGGDPAKARSLVPCGVPLHGSRRADLPAGGSTRLA